MNDPSPGKGDMMPTAEMLWTIQEERRRAARAIARERLTLARGRSARSIGALVGWMRERVRVFRRPTPGQIGWTSSGDAR